MPSIITHDTFGREIYAELSKTIGQSNDEKKAFLLGCQGPDVFFYGIVNPLTPQANRLAKKLHRSKCAEFLSALALSVTQVNEEVSSPTLSLPSEKDIARAYALGYLMHFELDSRIHPFVFSQTYALCSAGVPGLDARSQSEVHVEIECELDELVLTMKRGQTISTFDPSTEILLASDRILNIVGLMFEQGLKISHSEHPPQNCFRLSVKAYRQTLRWLYSTTGVKRQLIGRFETLFRQHSYLRAMIHKNIRLTKSIFDNTEHIPWKDPWVKNSQHRASFWDLYDESVAKGKDHVIAYATLIDALEEENREKMNAETFRQTLRNVFTSMLKITENKNFYGCDEAIANEKTGKPEQ